MVGIVMLKKLQKEDLQILIFLLVVSSTIDVEVVLLCLDLFMQVQNAPSENL